MGTKHKRYLMNVIPFNRITLENICGKENTPPASYWAPRREEIQRFVDIAKAVYVRKGKPIVLDVGCGTGLLAYLLAQTGEVEVIGLDPDKSLIKESTYHHQNLKLEVGDSGYAVKKYSSQDVDLVINSWMPYQLNLTPDIRKIGARVIAYIKEGGGATGVPDYDYEKLLSDEGFDSWDDDAENHSLPNSLTPENGISYHPGDNYRRAFEWSGPSAIEVQEIAEKLKGKRFLRYGNSNYNLIDIQFRKDLPIPDKIPRTLIVDSQKYKWESGLEKIKGPPYPMQRSQRFS